MSEVIQFRQRNSASDPHPPTVDGLTEHMFEYDKDGSRWGLNVWAKDEADARDRLRMAAEGAFVGICVARIDV